MTKEEKLNCFENELQLIQSEDIRNFLSTAIENLFDYIFIKPASSSGKYHPLSDLGEGGLIRHIKGVFYLGVELLKIDFFKQKFNQREQDMILVALILHDSWKYGDEEENRIHTVATHPVLAATWIEQNEVFDNILSQEDRKYIGGCVACHSGQWNTNKKGEEILPTPVTQAEHFVHMCDYIASRRFLNFDFSQIDTKVEQIVKPEDYVVTFGKKHNGKTLQQIFDTDYSYLIWAKDNLRMEPARTYIQKFLQAKDF